VGNEKGIQMLIEKPQGRGHFENLGVDERAILNLMFKKWDIRMWNLCQSNLSPG
jgi:hypothetical protein